MKSGKRTSGALLYCECRNIDVSTLQVLVIVVRREYCTNAIVKFVVSTDTRDSDSSRSSLLVVDSGSGSHPRILSYVCVIVVWPAALRTTSSYCTVSGS
jgi:hypothetical protein